MMAVLVTLNGVVVLTTTGVVIDTAIVGVEVGLMDVDVVVGGH